MRRALVALSSGALFAVGLALSGMTDPAKILGFLDLAGAWDPSLAFVIAAAVGFHALWLRVVARRPPAGASMPPSTGVDARLVIGAALFGVGWGLSGFCPGPGLVTLAFGRVEAAVFVGAMLLGVALFQLPRRLTRES